VKFLKSASVYFFTYAINAGISVVTISILTRYISPADYGIVNLYASFLLLLTPLISGGTLYPVSVEFFKKERKDYRVYFSNVLILLAVILLVVFGVVAACSPLIAQRLHIPIGWIILAPLTAFFITINEISIILARDQNQPWVFTGFSLGKTVLETGLSLVLVCLLGFLWQGRVAGSIIAPGVFVLLAVFFFSRWRFLTWQPDRKLIKAIFFASVPYIFERFSVFILSSSDRFFIDAFDQKGTTEVGLYGVGSQIATMNFMVIQALSGVYQPFVFKRLANQESAQARKGTWLYIAGCFAFMLLLYIAIPFVFRFLIGKEFQEGIRYAYILTGAYFMWAIYYGFLVYLLFHYKSRLVLLIAAIGMLVSISLNLILVRQYGAWGATITAICVYTTMAVISFLAARKYFYSNPAPAA